MFEVSCLEVMNGLVSMDHSILCFVPIMKLFNVSLKEQRFPTSWKTSYIMPIFTFGALVLISRTIDPYRL